MVSDLALASGGFSFSFRQIGVVFERAEMGVWRPGNGGVFERQFLQGFRRLWSPLLFACFLGPFKGPTSVFFKGGEK